MARIVAAEPVELSTHPRRIRASDARAAGRAERVFEHREHQTPLAAMVEAAVVRAQRGNVGRNSHWHSSVASTFQPIVPFDPPLDLVTAVPDP
jgi:hypothetical protein